MVSSLKHKIGNLEAIYVSPKPPSGETGKIIYPTVEETKNKYLNPYINEYGRFYVMLDYFYNWTNFEKRLIINNKFQCD